MLGNGKSLIFVGNDGAELQLGDLIGATGIVMPTHVLQPIPGQMIGVFQMEDRLVIADPETVVKAADDAMILNLMRRLRENDQELLGQYLIVGFPHSTQEGIITTVQVDRVAYEPVSISFGTGYKWNINNFAERSIWIVLAANQEEARAALATRDALLHG